MLFIRSSFVLFDLLSGVIRTTKMEAQEEVGCNNIVALFFGEVKAMSTYPALAMGQVFCTCCLL
jgi:hypothetical protein